MSSPEGKNIDALLSEFESDNSADKTEPPQVIELEEIKDKLASAKEDIPVPEDLSAYPEAVKQYFLDHAKDENLKVNISIDPLEGHSDRFKLLTAIAMNLRDGIFEYFGEQIERAGEDKIPGIKAIIGEPVENVRYAEVNPTLKTITVILEKRLGNIYIDLINAANTPPEELNKNKKDDDRDTYALHGQGFGKLAEADVEKGGLVEVENDLFAVGSGAQTVAYEDVIKIDFNRPKDKD